MWFDLRYWWILAFTVELRRAWRCSFAALSTTWTVMEGDQRKPVTGRHDRHGMCSPGDKQVSTSSRENLETGKDHVYDTTRNGGIAHGIRSSILDTVYNNRIKSSR